MPPPGDGESAPLAPPSGLLIDLDGVVYEGERAVPGAAEALEWLEQQGIAYLFLSNTTSRPRSALVAKLAGMGVHTSLDRILTPPIAAVAWLREQRIAGPLALFVPTATRQEFTDFTWAPPGAEQAAAVVVGDYGERWDFAELNRAFRLLIGEARPPLLALGMTRYWRAPDGLRLDAGPFVVALAHAADVEPVVLGKPSGAFFRAALARLGIAAGRAWLIGDDIGTDVGGAQRAGLHGALVRTGKFRVSDLDGDVAPDVVLESLAELPARWEDLH